MASKSSPTLPSCGSVEMSRLTDSTCDSSNTPFSEPVTPGRFSTISNGICTLPSSRLQGTSQTGVRPLLGKDGKQESVVRARARSKSPQVPVAPVAPMPSGRFRSTSSSPLVLSTSSFEGSLFKSSRTGSSTPSPPSTPPFLFTRSDSTPPSYRSSRGSFPFSTTPERLPPQSFS